MVLIRFSFAFLSVAISTMLRSDSLATSRVFCLSFSEFCKRSWFVVSVIFRCSFRASCCRYSPSAMTIWLFHKG